MKGKIDIKKVNEDLYVIFAEDTWVNTGSGYYSVKVVFKSNIVYSGELVSHITVEQEGKIKLALELHYLSIPVMYEKEGEKVMNSHDNADWFVDTYHYKYHHVSILPDNVAMLKSKEEYKALELAKQKFIEDLKGVYDSECE